MPPSLSEDRMANKHEILGSRYHGAEMLGSEAVREIFTLRRLGSQIRLGADGPTYTRTSVTRNPGKPPR